MLNYDAVIGAVVTLALVAVIIERALAVPFEHRLYEKYLKGRGFKSIIAVVVSYLVCRNYGFDVFSMMFGRDVSTAGLLVTAFTVAGGEKVVILLAKRVRDVKTEIQKAATNDAP